MEIDFDTELQTILTADKRYARNAYLFVFEALRYTQENAGERRHVDGRELLEGIREFATQEFGGLAIMVFSEWGVCSTKDFGAIVFNLVGRGLMGKTDTDTLEDFRDVYSFEEAFPRDSAAGPEAS